MSIIVCRLFWTIDLKHRKRDEPTGSSSLVDKNLYPSSFVQNELFCEYSQMKLAFIFISALVAITHQQFQQQQPSGRSWWSPYSYPQQLPSIVADRREIYYNLQDDTIPSIRRSYRPVRPVPYFPQNVELDPSFVADDYYQDDFNAEEDYPDVHSRNKVSSAIRYRPFSNNQQQQRFFFNYYNSNINSILTKTVTFTLTSTVSLTTVQSCIAAANFLDAAAQTTPCRRKRDILENAQEDAQFIIAPSETQRVTPTALPSLDVIRKNRQLPVDDNISGSISQSGRENLRVKRFLKYSVTSVTVTTYSFLSATVTKPVAIGAAAAVLCLPSGWHQNLPELWTR
ncbi:hypothetical protein DAPPUDRAFT_101160 [Daphnia pulex]|uniref:Uncharacterized protein n=1 Tax=Daphnia pulex TaxID=6669 RepID=E9GCI7_DAPPU|nr:hypothetical protein DAPPUDRAFT_101160 [Daphnia pulex]|eukprot:EFX82564.1 hypothetical protein DAPPUDRAFT_101160 [Daphnia pulex]